MPGDSTCALSINEVKYKALKLNACEHQLSLNSNVIPSATLCKTLADAEHKGDVTMCDLTY